MPVAVDDLDASATPVTGYVHVCGVHIKCRTHTAAGPPPSPEQLPRLVVTPSVRGNLETFAHALCGGRPILLEGPPGCGKSSMLRYFASLTGACGGGCLVFCVPPHLSLGSARLCCPLRWRVALAPCDDDSKVHICQSSEAQI